MCEQVRAARNGDIARLAEILIFSKRVAYRPIYQNDAVSFGEMLVLDTAVELQQHPDRLQTIAVYDDGILRGMINRGPARDPDRAGGLELYELYVDPFFQRMGIGKALMKVLLEEARRDWQGRACLWVLEENSQARAFYSSYGWVPDGARREVEGTGHMEIRCTLGGCVK